MPQMDRPVLYHSPVPSGLTAVTTVASVRPTTCTISVLRGHLTMKARISCDLQRRRNRACFLRCTLRPNWTTIRDCMEAQATQRTITCTTVDMEEMCKVGVLIYTMAAWTGNKEITSRMFTEMCLPCVSGVVAARMSLGETRNVCWAQ